MMEGINYNKPKEENLQEVNTGLSMDDAPANQRVGENSDSILNGFQSELTNFKTSFLDSLNKKIEEIKKRKEVETEEFFKNTEAGKYIANQETLHEYAAGREMETMANEKETSEELKGYKQNAMQFIREKFANDPVAMAYLNKQTEYGRLLVELDNLEREVGSKFK